MTNNSPQNTFFSLVTGKESTEHEVTEIDKDTDTRDAELVEMLKEQTDKSTQKTEHGSLDDVINPGDSSDSTMPHDARRVLVQLMRQGTVMASQKPKLFELLGRYEGAIRKHLSEVYLQLILDPKAGVAFVASVDSVYNSENVSDSADHEEQGSEESTTLISKRTLSLFDTLILLVLRKHYQDRESAGEQKIIIDIERLESYLTPFLPITDHASKDRQKLLARVKALVSKKYCQRFVLLTIDTKSLRSFVT